MSIQSEIGRIQSARDAIAGAITAKGVAVPDSTRIDGMAEKIAAIKTTPILQSKSVMPGRTAQTVQPDSGYDGLSGVAVAGDADLVAANIKSGVNIFGVAGTLPTGAQVASGSSTLNNSSTLTITPGFIVKRICIAPYAQVSSGNVSQYTGGLYNNGECNGAIMSVESTSASTAIKLNTEKRGTVYWLATT